MKAQHGGGRHIEFQKMSLSLLWIKIRQRRTNMTTDQKSAPEVNSHDVVSRTLETEDIN